MRINSNYNSASLITSSINPLKILYLLIPLLAALIIGSTTMGTSDTMNVISWILVLMVFGIAALPLSAYLFKNSNSAGFFLSQPLGLILVSVVIWTFTYIGIFRFNRIFIIAIILAMGCICYLIKPLRHNLVNRLSAPGVLENIAFEELIFAVALTVLCYLKGFLPDINGQEKFMDYGFIMSMLRNPTLPAKDMWLAGYNINYYYFGQFIYSLIIKLSGITPGIGYNIAMCSAIAIPFAMCYSIGTLLIDTARRFGVRCSGFMAHATGLVCAFAAMILGNSHSFFYDENSFGNGLLDLFQKMGIDVGRTDHFFYPDSTRFIGYNPDSSLIKGIANGGDYTIEEFPFYSFLVGDLHAHVVSTMVVLLIMALTIALIGKIAAMPAADKSSIIRPSISNLSFERGILKDELKKLLNLEVIIIAIILGCAQMTNYWDFLIYFIFCSMTLLIINTRRTGAFANIIGSVMFVLVIGGILLSYLLAGNMPLIHIVLQICMLIYAFLAVTLAPCALTRTSFGMSFIFTVANIIALPFNLNFDMISNSIALAVNHSSPFQLFILYGTHVLVGLAFIIIVIATRNYVKGPKRSIQIFDEPAGGWPNPIAKFFGQRNIVDIFVCGMVIVGIILIIAPEIFYVRDIYTSGYLRANTMFKFTYAAFIILSIAMGYAISRMFWFVNKEGEFTFGPLIVGCIALVMLVFIPGHYPGAALKQRNGEITRENYKGLDGLAYIDTFSSRYTGTIESGNLEPYMECINWFNNNVEGNHVILETYGESYTDYDMISAYTGLQTVCGWQTHEWLWRYKGVVDKDTNLLVPDPNHDVFEIYLNPRYDDINTVYFSDDTEAIQAIIDKYNIEYIIIGELETRRFAVDNTDTIASLGEIVFSYETLNVVKVTPSGTH